eukprot:3385954-Pyramimonas_sp.AAC.1
MGHLGLVDQAGGFEAYERNWQHDSGVYPGSAAPHQHRAGSETLRLLIEVDQVDASNLQGVENLCRRQVQLEMAVERNPSHPDFTGLEECMGGAVTASGAASVVSLREWVAGRQKDRAT